MEEKMSAPNDTENLCVTCHLCCTGALFSKLPITSEEAATLGPIGEYFTLDDEQLYLRLGCSALGSNGACTRYKTRPSGCGEYQCNVLKNVKKGNLHRMRAEYVVAEAKRLNDDCLFFIREVMPVEFWDFRVTTASKAMIRLQIVSRREGVFEKKQIDIAFQKWYDFADYIIENFYDDPDGNYRDSVYLNY